MVVDLLKIKWRIVKGLACYIGVVLFKIYSKVHQGRPTTITH